MRRTSLRLPVAALLCLLGACGGALTLLSQWKDREVTIDGQDREWGDVKVDARKAPLRIGLMNDAQNLYLTLSTQDPRLKRQILGQGLIVWFDPRGGKDKTFGIRAPIGLADELGPPRRGEPDEEEPTEEMHERLAQALHDATDEVELLDPNEEQGHTVALKELQGLEIQLGMAGDTLVYEMKAPLLASAGQPAAIGAPAGAWIGLGLETPRMEPPEIRPDMRRGGRRGRSEGGGWNQMGPGFPGGGRGGRGGPPMGGPPMRGGPPEPLELWAKVSLAGAEPIP